MERIHDQVHELDSRKWSDDAAQAVNQKVPPEEYGRTQGPETDAPQGQRDQGDDDESIEDDGTQDGAQG
jgi:hypothetical protein